ncbi:MAG: HpcH/HpaI aldolase/citrate lyase family protein [Clostridium argentinense]|uniref:HpcH/HpaI aldolase/citrate lyase family protein n=1 Tax=Clostridium faecium TaxID=2762223 RepID=A0ABR8YTD2_9CLOT|nr:MULTISPECIES: HpcH/HpaI aldolase/citrate lyase family protein [Clostridium]MBD8047522.1 HpcH/HpaI aldolase/citrate lyase family protein [Clostridium faecium]MBS5823848.1 HpcH/HpaI aldolase/citrate lyase family protein [Clostridium argentinense]MDU1348780.1 HpcH/HpaI aldolase/citrate lyase family protein [Clostridium argentinense]
MNYFGHIDNYKDIFFIPPEEYSLHSSKEILSHSLGATLYMNPLKGDLFNNIFTQKKLGANTIVICLEDAVSDSNVAIAEKKLIETFLKIKTKLSKGEIFLDDLPLLFIRVRNVTQFDFFLNNCPKSALCGFVFPKFTSSIGEEYFDKLEKFNFKNNTHLYGMPILESHEILYKECRLNELIKIRAILKKYNSYVLNVRIGGTDLCGILGIRRGAYDTIYDVLSISDCINDIINVFKSEGFVISAVVHEYYDIHNINVLSALVKEVHLDIINGLTGKVVIHPNQVNIVNSLYAVSYEDYMDAEKIVASSENGVLKSNFNNKMNEVKPHLIWAKNILLRGKIMGVLNNGFTYKNILQRLSKV